MRVKITSLTLTISAHIGYIFLSLENPISLLENLSLKETSGTTLRNTEIGLDKEVQIKPVKLQAHSQETNEPQELRNLENEEEIKS